MPRIDGPMHLAERKSDKREAHITLPELAMIAGTRAALGAGIGLLLADRLTDGQRKAVGWTLLAIGAVVTIPLAIEVIGAVRSSAPTGEGSLYFYGLTGSNRPNRSCIIDFHDGVTGIRGRS